MKTKLLIFYDNTSTKKLIAELNIRDSSPDDDLGGWTDIWIPDFAEQVFPATHIIRAAIYKGSMTLTSTALGGGLT